jgi:hypothetical protein
MSSTVKSIEGMGFYTHRHKLLRMFCYSILVGIADLSFRLVRNLSFKKDAGMTDFSGILYYAQIHKSSCII